MFTDTPFRFIMTVTVLSIFFVIVNACALLTPAADKVAKGVDSYCQKLSLTERQLIRNSINPTPAGNNVHVHCLGDSPNTD